jgi:hypothetical protein
MEIMIVLTQSVVMLIVAFTHRFWHRIALHLQDWEKYCIVCGRWIER